MNSSVSNERSLSQPWGARGRSLLYLIPLLVWVNTLSVAPTAAQDTRPLTTVTVTGNVVNDATGQRIVLGPNPGTKSRKSNQDCTICVSCR